MSKPPKWKVTTWEKLYEEALMQIQQLLKQLDLAQAEVVQWKGYADTLQRVNEEQKRANDDLFTIKQKVVIANRELVAKLAELQQ